MTSQQLAPAPGTRQGPPRTAGGRIGALLLGRRVREAAAIGGPALAVMALGWQQRWVGDDGMIYARTVRQILAGHGPVFNVGERAEASTGTLWQWLVAAAAYVSGRDPSLLAVALGIALTGAGYALAVAAARRAVRPLTAAPLLPLGMLVLLAVKADWDYATSGLENGLSAAWIGLAWWRLVAARDAYAPVQPESAAADGTRYDRAARTVRAAHRRGGTYTLTGSFVPRRTESRRRGVWPTAFLLGLGPLVRPDLAIVTAVFLVALWWMVRPGAWRGAGLLAAACALPAGYEVFRAGYYGVLVPLPALTKEASDAVWARGWAYFGNFAEPYRLWVPLLLLVLLALGAPRALRRALRPELLAPPVAGLLSWAYVCRVGGDFMHGRLLLPGLMLLALPLCAVPVPGARGAEGGGRAAGAIGAAGAGGAAGAIGAAGATGSAGSGGTGRAARRWFVPVAAALAVWAVLCAVLWRPPASTGSPYLILDEQADYKVYTNSAHPVSEAVHADRDKPLRAAVAAAAAAGRPVLLLQTPASDGRFVSLPLAHRLGHRIAGAYDLLGYNGIVTPLADASVDPLGLAYPLVAHQERPARRTDGRSGHEKPVDPAWIVADLTDPGTPVPAGVDPARVAAARTALSCGPLAALQSSVRAPLTPSRFWRNLTGAWSRTAFRYPADPVIAAHRLCRR
jgi:arabinofuranosyltransferase